MTQPALFETEDEAPAAPPPPPKPGKAKPTVRQLPPYLPEPWQVVGRVGSVFRTQTARELGGIVTDFSDKRATEDELTRFICGATWVLTAEELCRVAGFMAELLKEPPK